MSARILGHYAETIRRLLRCTPDEAVMIEDIMRNDVLHTVALDWPDVSEFNAAARKAALLLAASRADYETYYAGTRAVFEQMRSAQSKTA